jgi:hypothetical protein
MTLQEVEELKEAFEADGSQAMEVYVTKEQAVELRRELNQLYGFDNGERLTPLYGMEVVDIDAEEFRIA